METSFVLTGYDFVVIGLALLFIVRGLWLGLLKQVTGLLALGLGYFFASQYHDRLFPFLKDLSDNPKVIFITSVVILFVVTFAIVMLLGKALSYVVEITFSKWFDRLLGTLLGAIKACLVVVLMHLVLGSILPPENAMLRECKTCDGLNAAADYARLIIRDEDVRQSLIQQTPAISTEEVMQFFDEALQNGNSNGQNNSSTSVE
jgi:membrane protein required for colicin V production